MFIRREYLSVETKALNLRFTKRQDLSGETDNTPNNLNPHIPGASSLLHLRNASQFRTKYGQDLFGWAIVQIVGFPLGP